MPSDRSSFTERKREEIRRSQNASIFLGSSFEAFWDAVILPWFKNASRSWSCPLPSVVLVPDRSCVHFLKFRLMEAGYCGAALKILTPSEYRRQLCQGIGYPWPLLSRENLHLLMSAAAGVNKCPEPAGGRSLATAVASHPAEFVRHLDMLQSAGWGMGALDHAELRLIFEGYQNLVKQSGSHFIFHLDSRLKDVFKHRKPVVEHLLVYGFYSAHWSLRDFFEAALFGAKHSTLCFSQPRLRGEEMDQIWSDSFEEWAVQDTIPLDPSPSGSFHALSEAMEFSRKDLPKMDQEISKRLTFRVGKTMRDQAHAAALQAVAYLNEGTCKRLGIIVPSTGILSREISARLSEWGLSHYDGPGYEPAVDVLASRFTALLELEKRRSLPAFLNYLEKLPSRDTRFPGFTISDLKRALLDAFSILLVEDLEVLACFLTRHPDKKISDIGDWLKKRPRFPGEADFQEFFTPLKELLVEAELQIQEVNIQARAGTLIKQSSFKISKAVWIQWLEEITANTGRIRDPMGSNPYAPIQLLTYAEAEHQSWTHLILTSLNEHLWPPSPENPGFLSDQKIKELNQQAMEMGKHGLGHSQVTEAHTLILGAAEQRAIYQRQFFQILELASEKCCVTASMREEGEGENNLMPGVHFSHLYRAVRGEALTVAAWEELSLATHKWLKLEGGEAKGITERYEAVQQAWTARRDAGTPFGPFEFSLKKGMKPEITLACKEWEDVMRCPALVWMKHFLGVRLEDLDLEEDQQSQYTGIWIHRWLSSSFDPDHAGLCPLPDSLQLGKSLEKAASLFRSKANDAFVEAGQFLPIWWDSIWEESYWKARRLMDRLPDLSFWKSARSEWSLPPTTVIKSHGLSLRLKGRVDLILFQTQEASENDDLLVIDFKSGSSKAKSSHDLIKSKELQIALYALALKEGREGSVYWSLVKTGGPEVPPKALKESELLLPICQTLNTMQDSGIFGMLEDIGSEHYRSKAFPLAVLPVCKDILDSKWELTHLIKEVADE